MKYGMNLNDFKHSVYQIREILFYSYCAKS